MSALQHDDCGTRAMRRQSRIIGTHTSTVTHEDGAIATLGIVEARQALGRVSKNATANSPHMIRGDDTLVYVLKPSGTDRQFANELLALALATLVDVPVFDGALVTVPDALHRNADTEFQARYGVGVHFGSRRPDEMHFDFWNVSPALVQGNIRNFEALYTLTVFDELIANGDRAGNPGNLMAVQKHATAPTHEFFAIDHGHAFTGQGWTTDQLEAHIPAPIYPVLQVVRDLLKQKVLLEREASKLSGYVDRFQATVDGARTGLNDRDRAAVVHLLQERAPMIDGWTKTPAYAAHLPSLQ